MLDYVIISNVKTAPKSSPKYFSEIKNHYDTRFYKEYLDNKQRQAVLPIILKSFAEFMSTHDLQFIIMHGSLIGWWWNKESLTWDEDIDLCVTLATLEVLDTLQEKTSDVDFLLDVNKYYQTRESANKHHTDAIEQNRIDARYIYKQNGMYIDLTALAPIDGKLISKCPHIYEIDHILPLQKSVFMGVDVWTPNNVEAVLHQEYGKQCTKNTECYNYCWDSSEKIWVLKDIPDKAKPT